MAKIQFERISSKNQLENFDCGNASINIDIKEAYFPDLLQHAYTYCVKSGETTLGVYQIMFREVQLDDFPEDISDFTTEIKDNTISAVHIRFVAVEKKYQHNKIGKMIVQSIIKQVEQLNLRWPVRIITIDALEDLVPWYESIGFKKAIYNPPESEGITVAMFFDCMSLDNKTKIEECHEEV